MQAFIRHISAALALALVFTVCVSAASALPRVRFKKDGDQPELISCAEDLLALAELVNSGETCEGRRFVMTDDIDISAIGAFTPIGDGLTSEDGVRRVFKGSFSGGSHRITGLHIEPGPEYQYAALFGMTEGGEITGLSVTGAFVSGAHSAGGVTGYANGTVLDDLLFEGSVRASFSAGGITASCENVVITGCEVRAAVESSEYAGGVCGIAGHAHFTNCTPSGTVSSLTDAGGVAGYAFDSALVSCANRARVSGGDYVSGAVGIAQTTSFECCENLGPITGERFVGGIAGRCCGSDFTACVNRGAIFGEDYIGGVIGWSDDGADFGDNGLINYMLECMNTGSVTGNWGVGGLIGDSHDAVVWDCFNTGRIISDQYAGGLTGYTAESSFSRCYNAGSVFANTAADAIAGRVSFYGADFENCVFLDTCCENGENGIARDAMELLYEAAYEGFDFEEVWTISDTGYPYAHLMAVDPPLPESGDTDGDGDITSVDALTALRSALGIIQLAPLERFRADMNCDGLIDSSDALLILRAALGIV